MRRRTFLKSGMALPAVAVGGLPRIAFGDSTTADWRVFEVTTRVKMLEPAGVSRVWLPLPLVHDTNYFNNLGSRWSAEHGSARFFQTPVYDAGMVVTEFPNATAKPEVTLISRFAAHNWTVDLSRPPSNPKKEDPAALRLALMGTDLIPVDGIVRDTAMKIVKGRRGAVEKAHAIYEWMVENTTRNPKTRGCGWGNIKAMLETHDLSGKCGDLSALFVGLARSVGVPARDVYGIRVAPSREGYVSLGANNPGDISKAQHCRAEFYADGYGWVPVDPADVRKVMLEEPPGHLPLTNPKVERIRKRLFGSWEMNWMPYNYAHDVKLPGSGEPRIPYLMYPNGETAQGRLDPLSPAHFEYHISAREITL